MMAAELIMSFYKADESIHNVIELGAVITIGGKGMKYPAVVAVFNEQGCDGANLHRGATCLAPTKSLPKDLISIHP